MSIKMNRIVRCSYFLINFTKVFHLAQARTRTKEEGENQKSSLFMPRICTDFGHSCRAPGNHGQSNSQCAFSGPLAICQEG